MSLIRLHRNVAKHFAVNINTFSTAALENDEYTPTPNYPPILDLSPEKVLERRKEALYEEIKAVRTVEEKQIKLNMPKYYGFKSYMFEETRIPYGQLPLIQHITRTHLIVKDHLPEYYNKINVDDLLADIKNDIEETLLMEYNYCRKTHEILNEEIDERQKNNLLTRSLTRQLNRILINNISRPYPHLLDSQVDFDPRIESSWLARGINPPELIKKARRGQEHTKPKENEPTNRVIQYLGSPVLTVRSKLPLSPVIPYSDADNEDFEIPYFKYDPRVVGTTTTHRHVSNIPGFWPGDGYQYGIVSYHGRSHFINRNFNDPIENVEGVHRQGILACFGWLNAIVNYLGFTTFNDITYPLVTQSVITDGQTWSFYVYQLNTLINHSKYVKENTRRNVCWATPELKLFAEIKDGKVIGFNDDVLKMLVKYYANIPEERLGINMRPYLDQTYKLSADYEDDDKRNWLEREYKYLMSNRPRFKQFYEVYNWEKIYKIDHKTRPMEAKRRPFELGLKPWNRTLDDRQPIYIPRAKRPHLPRNKGKYEKEYFP